MRFRPLKHWNDSVTDEGLVFLVQLLEELLFPYSLDTYKPSATNASTLCIEAITIIKAIDDELIDENNLRHILKELVLNLKKDQIVKSLISLDINNLIGRLENEDTKLHEVSILLKIIYSHINLKVYKTQTEKTLLAVISTPKEKDKIRTLARSYITTLINIGYSTRYLRSAVMIFFYKNKKNKVDGVKSLEEFFRLFDGSRKNFTTIFKVNKLFDEIKDSCETLGIQVDSILDGSMAKVGDDKGFQLHGNELYLIIKDISAMDIFSARDIAESKINQMSTLISFFHHEESTIWQPNALMIENEFNKGRLLQKSPNPMLLCSDSRIKNAAIKLNSFINNFNLTEIDSFERFNRAMELHALALRSDSSDNQLLNLWISLETIVPSKSGRTKAKINNIIDSVIPFLTIVHIENLLNRLTHDFILWDKIKFLNAIAGIEGNSKKEQLIKLLVLPEYSKTKDQLFNDLQQFHLLRNRAYYFSNILSDSSKIASLHEAHHQRLDWQIRRIYRTRNMLVHSGETPAFISILIKNLHDYFDTVINIISALASDGMKINTIDQAFKYVELTYGDYFKNLKGSNEKVTAENIYKLILINCFK
jgi:hypothetical protein